MLRLVVQLWVGILLLYCEGVLFQEGGWGLPPTQGLFLLLRKLLLHALLLHALALLVNLSSRRAGTASESKSDS